MIVTVFRDRSWIVQQEPMGGAPPMVGTREDEHRIVDLSHTLDLIHRGGLKTRAETRAAGIPRISWTPRETNTPSSESRCPAAGFREAVSAGQEERSNPKPQPETPARKKCPTPWKTPWRKPSAKNT